VNGATPKKQRQLNIEKFLKNSETRLFIGNIKAAGVGWSAKGVSDVAFARWTGRLETIYNVKIVVMALGEVKKNVRSTS